MLHPLRPPEVTNPDTIPSLWFLPTWRRAVSKKKRAYFLGSSMSHYLLDVEQSCLRPKSRRAPREQCFTLVSCPPCLSPKGSTSVQRDLPETACRGSPLPSPAPTPLPYLCLQTHMNKAPTSTPCKQIYAIAPTKLTNVWTPFCYSIRHTCTHTHVCLI